MNAGGDKLMMMMKMMVVVVVEAVTTTKMTTMITAIGALSNLRSKLMAEDPIFSPQFSYS